MDQKLYFEFIINPVIFVHNLLNYFINYQFH